MAEHEAEQQRIISIIEEIESLDNVVSSLDYEISVANAETVADIWEQMHRLQHQSNDLVNDLKAEGITIDYDGPLVYLSKDGKPWMERTAKGDWIENKPVLEEQAATSEALAVFTQFLDMLKNGPDETLELFKLVTGINHPAISQERRVSKVETTCPVCGYQEDIVFTPEFYQEHNGKFVDVLASMLELMGNCPQCQEDLRLANIEQEREHDIALREGGYYNVFPEKDSHA